MKAERHETLNVHKHIVTDEENRPVAVQIDYADWQRIEAALSGRCPTRLASDLARFAGTLQWGEDAVHYQRRVREEWQR